MREWLAQCAKEHTVCHGYFCYARAAEMRTAWREFGLAVAADEPPTNPANTLKGCAAWWATYREVARIIRDSEGK